MESSEHPRRTFLKRGCYHRTARTLLVTLAAFAVIAIALSSVKAAVTTTFTQTNLVSDVSGMAKTIDPNLVNPWGMTL